MKVLISVLLICVAVGLLVAGCTTPVTMTPTPTTTATPTPTATAPVTDPALAGSWTLGEMGLQGGQAPLTVFPQPITITITISEPGILAGNGGCNNYGGTYTLTGTSGPFGKAIIMGPIASNMKYCSDSSDIENSYFQILSNVTSYGIDNNTTLSMRDPLGSTLVFQRT
jgi:heat shock protein HslJ